MPSIRIVLWAMAFFFAVGMITAAATGRRRSLVDTLRDWVDRNHPDADRPDAPDRPAPPDRPGTPDRPGIPDGPDAPDRAR